MRKLGHVIRIYMVVVVCTLVIMGLFKKASARGIVLAISKDNSELGKASDIKDGGLVTLDDVVSTALMNNPGIMAAKKRWEASLSKPTVVSSLPDPVLKVTYFIEEIETRNGPLEGGVSISQRLPWIGKLSLKKKVAELEAAMVSEDYVSNRLKVIYEVKKAFFEFYWIDRAITITRTNINILKQLEGLIRVKYITGEVAQQDLLKVQIELLRLQNDLNTFIDMKSTIKVKLNTLLGRPSRASLGKPEEIKFKVFNMSLDELYNSAKESSPIIRFRERVIERWKAKKRLAKLDYLPDVTLGVQYQKISKSDSPMAPRNGQDAWSVTFAINLPIWLQKRKGAVVLAEKEVLSGLSSFQDEENKLFYKIKESYFKVKTAQREIILYKESLIPRAEQSLQIAKEDYRAGRSGFLDLIDSQRILLRFQLSYERALTEFRKNIAKLEEVVGEELY